MANFKIVFRDDEPMWQPGCPLLIEAVQISRNIDSAQCYLQIKCKNISDKVIRVVSLQVSIIGKDSADETLVLDYFDSDIQVGDAFTPRAKKIETVEPQSVSICVTRVDDTKNYPKLEKRMEAVPLCLSKKALGERNAQGIECSVKTGGLKFRHREFGSWWLCSCGSANVGRTRCHSCSAPLSKLSSWEDEGKLELAADERRYKMASEALSSESYGSIQDAIEMFEQLGSYKDSQSKAVEAKAKASDLSQKKGKRKKTIAIAVGVVAALIAIVLLSVFVIIPNVRLSFADSMMQNGQYDEAIAVYEDLGESEKVSSATSYKAGALLKQDGQYAAAVCSFSRSRSFLDSEAQIESIKQQAYDDALAMAKTGDAAMAKTAFEALGDYQDSKQQIGFFCTVPISVNGTSIRYDSNGFISAIGEYTIQCDEKGRVTTCCLPPGHRRIGSNENYSYEYQSDGTIVETSTGEAWGDSVSTIDEEGYRKDLTTQSGQRSYSTTVDQHGFATRQQLSYSRDGQSDIGTVSRVYRNSYNDEGLPTSIKMDGSNYDNISTRCVKGGSTIAITYGTVYMPACSTETTMRNLKITAAIRGEI